MDGSAPVENVDARLEAIAVDIEMTQAMAAIRMGERLAEARDLYRYKRDAGGFEGWVGQRLGLSKGQAYRLINVFERIGPKGYELVTLSREALFQIASTPEQQRQTVIETVKQMVVDGETVTAAPVKRLKREAEGADDLRAQAEARAERLMNRNKELEERLRETE